MGAYLSTDITSPQVIAAGGALSGVLHFTAPAAGHFYLVAEQYTTELVMIPGSRSFIHQVAPGGVYTNSTLNFTVLSPVAAGEAGLGATTITVLNTDCYLYILLKEISAIVVAGAFAIGTTYKIVSIGTTDFTLIGATANVVGALFTATGAGAGTGTACVIPDPDTDTTVDYVVVTLQSTSGGGTIDMGSIMNLMITMAMIGIMMKMIVSSVGKA